jgi:GT2 family glycosyltransferase
MSVTNVRDAIAAGAQREPLVAVVILNWREPDATIACVQAVRGLDYANKLIVVVDNGSAPAAVAALSRLEGIVLVCNAANLGFTGGVNVGLREAMKLGADHVWLLNNDAATEPGTLRKLVAIAEADPRIGLASPVIHDSAAPEKPLFCLGLFDRRGLGTTQTDDPGEARRWLAERPDDAIVFGTALLVTRRLFSAIGGFDERFFAYVEDVDYSLRCHAAGFRVAVCFDALVYHAFKEPLRDPDSCPPYLHYYVSRNYPLLWRKLSGGPLLFGRAALWFLRQRLLQLERMPGNRAAIEALLAGLWDGLLGRTGAYDPARRPPWLLRCGLGRHPGAVIRLLDGKLPIGRRADRP